MWITDNLPMPSADGAEASMGSGVGPLCPVRHRCLSRVYRSIPGKRNMTTLTCWARAHWVGQRCFQTFPALCFVSPCLLSGCCTVSSKKKILLLHLFLSMCMCSHACHSVCMESEDNLLESVSLIPHGAEGLDFRLSSLGVSALIRVVSFCPGCCILTASLIFCP